MMITKYPIQLLVTNMITSIGRINIEITLPTKHLGFYKCRTSLSKLTFNVLML